MTAKKKQKWASYEDYLQSDQWNEIRKQVQNRDGWVCQVCGVPLQDATNAMHCHHWRYPGDWNDDSAENVVLSCATCHREIHDAEFKVESKTYPEYLLMWVKEKTESLNYDASIATRQRDALAHLVAALIIEHKMSFYRTETPVYEGKIKKLPAFFCVAELNLTIPENIGELIVETVSDRLAKLEKIW